MRLSKRDIVATDPGSPFGGGVSSMGGGSSSGSGQAQEASPYHQGPPPAAAGAAQIKRCGECGKTCADGSELEEHMRKDHYVRSTMGSRTDVASPAAVVFIDALGDTLPFKASFTFKELSDFCRREGVHSLADNEELSDGDLIQIAAHVGTLTNNHVRIEPEPTVTAERSPLSIIDFNVAEEQSTVRHACKRCRGEVESTRLLCATCRTAVAARTDKTAAIELYAHVVLADGATVHVVEINGDHFVGVDDLFQATSFHEQEVKAVHNMSDDVRSIHASQCDVCGEEIFQYAAKCSNCGHRTAQVAE